jgi:hypothetical protein
MCVLFLFHPVRPRAQAVWVYDVPNFSHDNQAVIKTVSELGQFSG